MKGSSAVSPGRLAVGIHGACGRMGSRIIQLLAADERLALAAALERGDHPRLGEDAGLVAGAGALGIPVLVEPPPGVKIEVMIDFSLPPGALGIAQICADAGVPLVVGTTGFDPAERKRLEAFGGRMAMLISPNMSKAVNLLARLVRQAAAALGPECEVAIVERHHRTKKDAPSGTALMLARQVGRSVDVHALRMGDCAGEHAVIFGLMGETLELAHRAANRDGFALGSLDAARFLAGKPPGLYTVEDWLGG